MTWHTGCLNYIMIHRHHQSRSQASGVNMHRAQHKFISEPWATGVNVHRTDLDDVGWIGVRNDGVFELHDATVSPRRMYLTLLPWKFQDIFHNFSHSFNDSCKKIISCRDKLSTEDYKLYQKRILNCIRHNQTVSRASRYNQFNLPGLLTTPVNKRQLITTTTTGEYLLSNYQYMLQFQLVEATIGHQLMKHKTAYS
jgi:hypothetical protein